MNNLLRAVAPWATVAALALLGCIEITTPPEKASTYYGKWSGPNVQLSITPTRLEYDRRDGFNSASIAAPFRGLSGNNIVFGTKKSSLPVSVPPHQEGSTWKMTVDGVVVERR